MSELTTKEAMLERAVAALEKIKTVMGEINPAGVIQAFAGSTTPDGWLLCDGSAVSRTDYADLFSVIGTTYGDGDGSTTFNVPNLTDKFIEGSSTAGTVKAAGLPNITGSINSFFYNADTGITGAFKNAGFAETYPVTTNTGGYRNARADFKASNSNAIYGNSTTVQPPALTMQYIIKY